MSGRLLIRADGTTTQLPSGLSMAELRELIGADVLDTVRLRHMGEPLHVMLVDDLGIDKDLPVNIEATRLYHANCVPDSLPPSIRGDVVVYPDFEFAYKELGLWVCPWGICNTEHAQECRAEKRTTKMRLGCGTLFLPGTTLEQAKQMIYVTAPPPAAP